MTAGSLLSALREEYSGDAEELLGRETGGPLTLMYLLSVSARFWCRLKLDMI